MKAAISKDANQVAVHFGRCDGYEIVEIADGEIIGRRSIENPGHEPGALPRLMQDLDVECVIAGGMGPRAQQLFDQYDIRTIVGISGDLDTAVSALAAGDIESGDDQCHH
jgi:predicted Fe-Mo cluster-binding NifX family protein